MSIAKIFKSLIPTNPADPAKGPAEAQFFPYYNDNNADKFVSGNSDPAKELNGIEKTNVADNYPPTERSKFFGN